MNAEKDIQIIPISKKIGKKEALNAIKATEKEENFIGKGATGRAYVFKEKYVVKVFTDEKAFEKELAALMLLKEAEEDGLDIGRHSQRGICAFIAEKKYLLSTKVEGVEIKDTKTKIITRKQLQGILNIIVNLDKGFVQKDEIDLRYIYLHFDLGTRNILFTEEGEAGILDFALFRKEDLNWYLGKRPCALQYNILDDTAHMPSNLRLFEIIFIWLYHMVLDLQNILDKKENLKLFDTYLEEKANYLIEMSKYHKLIALKSGSKDILNLMAQEEMAHSRLLCTGDKKIDEEIRKAEIKKIQLANFFFQLQLHHVSDKIPNINIKQVEEYRIGTKDFFNSAFESAQKENNTDKITYFQNCIKFTNNFLNFSEKTLANANSDFHLPTLDEVFL